MGFFDQGGQTYDPNLPSTTPSAIDAGSYQADITEVEIKPTRDSRGQYVKVRHDIVGPSFQGRVLFANINIENPSHQAEAIGRQQLNDLQGAAGVHRVSQPQDLQQFVGRRVEIKVAKKKDAEYGDENGYKNEIKGWKAIAGTQMPPPQAAPANPTAPAPGKPPW